jgi:hypothetical protein
VNGRCAVPLLTALRLPEFDERGPLSCGQSTELLRRPDLGRRQVQHGQRESEARYLDRYSTNSKHRHQSLTPVLENRLAERRMNNRSRSA